MKRRKILNSSRSAISTIIILATLLGVNHVALSTTQTEGRFLFVNSRNEMPGDGMSWVTAHNSLITALIEAREGDSIWVASGTYRPTEGRYRTASFQLKDGVGLYGGFSGGEVSLDQRDWVKNRTILSGDIGQRAYLWVGR